MLNKPSGVVFFDNEVDNANVTIELWGAPHLVGPIGSLETEANPLKRLVNVLPDTFAKHKIKQTNHQQKYGRLHCLAV